jgi:hypothetical protein
MYRIEGEGVLKVVLMLPCEASSGGEYINPAARQIGDPGSQQTQSPKTEDAETITI